MSEIVYGHLHLIFVVKYSEFFCGQKILYPFGIVTIGKKIIHLLQI